MNRIHYRNIGFPKTGTTWLYKQFSFHPDVDCKLNLMSKEYRGKDKQDYVKKYNNFQVSVNLYTNLFSYPNQLYYSTHLSLTFRNIYDLLNSYYNYIKNKNPNLTINQKDFLNENNSVFESFINIEKILNDWKDYNLKYLFYDDLLNDSESYFLDICDYLGIEKYFDKRGKNPVFKTVINDQLIFNDEKIIKKINNAITIIEDKTKRDLSHWKK